MKGITLHQPWAGLIIYGRKRIENRKWRPGLAVGDRLAIHAGLKDIDVEDRIEKEILGIPSGDMAKAFTNGAILGDCRFMGIAHHAEEVRENQRIWFVGPMGWLLDDVRRLPVPYKIKGAQGLWTVPPEAELELEKTGVRVTFSLADSR